MIFLARNDFATHLRYARLVRDMSAGVSVATTLIPRAVQADLRRADAKENLIALTRRSLEDELNIVRADPEYSTAAVLWLPIKYYYLLYHRLSVVEFLLTGDPGVLGIRHGALAAAFTGRLRNVELVFSGHPLNLIYDGTILNYVSASGAILAAGTPDGVVRSLLMKKVAKERVDEFCRLKGIINARSLRNRTRIRGYISGMQVSIFDFFYLMRIRANYKNFDFIEGVPAASTRHYFDAYYTAARNFFDAFETLNHDLRAMI